MESWMLLTLIAVMGYGVQNFLYRVAAEQHYDSLRVNTYLMLTVSAIMLAGMLATQRFHAVSMIALAVMFATGFTWLVSNMVKIRSYQLVPLNVSFPVSRMYIALTPPLAFFVFGEQMNGTQVLGLIVAMAVILIISADSPHSGRRKHFMQGVALAALAAVLSAGNNIISKFAAISFDILPFMFGTYTMMAVLTMTWNAKKRKLKKLFTDHASLRLGCGIGIINAASYYLVLQALSDGPASIIFTLFGLNLVVAVGLAMLVYKEKFTTNRAVAFGLALVAVMLLR